ncbi:hypothetical protein T01_4107 [Trichinella spiralis]|uniref:Uncharacterized protein n=1 Tax=Trichinella spiralis TaxID=6334 RepID=A0A0V1ALV0_TRISP|nr:hypothetical protein T01_4107 [Trichinella spiralis]
MGGSKSIPTAGSTTHFVTSPSVGYSKATISGSQRLTYMAMQPLWDFCSVMTQPNTTSYRRVF